MSAFATHYNHVLFYIDGHLYAWIGGFGAQIYNMQWARPPAGAERTILGQRVRVFSTYRAHFWSRCKVTWSIPLSGSVDEQNAQIRDFEQLLLRMY